MAKLKLPFELEKPSANEYVTQASEVGYGDKSVEETLDGIIMGVGIYKTETQSLTNVPVKIKNGITYRFYNIGTAPIPTLYLRVDTTSTGQALLGQTIGVNNYVEFTADKDYNYLYIYEGSQSVNIFKLNVGEYPSVNLDVLKLQEDVASIKANNDSTFPSINAAALGFSGRDPFLGFIVSNGVWNTTTANTSYRIFGIKSGDSIVIKGHATQQTQYAFLKEYNKPSNNEAVQFCTGCSRVTMTANSEETLTAPVDAKYFYVLQKYTLSTKPQSLTINGQDVFNDTVLDKVAAIYSHFSEIDNQFAAVNAQFEPLIKSISCKLSGQASSYVTLTTPIVLSEDGDSVEIIASDGGNSGNADLSFASSGLSANSYHAIQLGNARLGIRATDGTWLFQSKAITGAATHTIKIEYDNNKIYTYADGVLVDTQNTQKTIQIASFGNGGNGTYGYWKGTISSIKVGDTEILKSGGFTATDSVELTVNYAFDSDSNPKGVLVYSAANSKFIFYSQLGNSNRYYSFEVSHTINNADTVYLNEWGLYGGGCYEYNGSSFTKIANTIINAENEMAMHFNNTIDYTGGIHGDERIDIDNSCFVKFFADGKLITDLSEDFTIKCATFSYIQKSTLHQTSSTQGEYVSGHPVIAYHLKNVIFKDCGFRLDNTVQFTSEQVVTQYHAGMMCVAKGAATYALLPNIVATPQLTGSTNYYTADNNKAAKVNMWNPENDIKVSVEGHYLEGLDDTVDVQQFQVWDRADDSKYYRRFVAQGAVATKTFAANSVIRNEQIVQYY